MTMMKATMLINNVPFKDYDVFNADLKILNVIPNASYYIPFNSHTYILVKSKNADFIVNGENYEAIGTNKYNELRDVECLTIQSSLDFFEEECECDEYE